MPLPSVTVVIPTHDRRHVLPTTLRAVLEQEDVDLTVVVVDDGSSDGTTGWLEGLTDPRVEVVRHDVPRRLPGARNAGIAVTRTPWVAFCDDDDLWAPGKLAAQLARLEATGARWSATGCVTVDGDLGILGHHRGDGGEVLDALLVENVVPAGASSVVVATDLVREVGGFDETLRSVEDWDVWIRLAHRSPLAMVDRPLTAYRLWPGSMSTDVGRMRTSWETVVAGHAGLAAERGVRPRPDLHERYLAKQHLRAGQRLGAAATFWRLATVHRRPEQLLRVPGALLVPGLTDYVGTLRTRRAVPAAWRAEAEAWLAPLRAPEAVRA